MPIERVVAILTPAFAALAGLITSSVGQLVPGVNLNKADVTALFIAGATAATSAALKWLHGRQKITSDLADVDKLADSVAQRVAANPFAGPAADNIEDLLKAHEANIVAAIGSAVHAPPSVEQVVEAMAQRLVGGQATGGPLVHPGARADQPAAGPGPAPVA